MNTQELKVEILRNNLSIPILAQRIGIDKKTMYCKIQGKSSFTQKEIAKISNALQLDKAKLCKIFFDDLVS